MKKKRKKVTARDWGVVNLIARQGGKGVHKSKKRVPRSTAKTALKKSLMRNNSHEAFLFSIPCLTTKISLYNSPC